MSIKISRENIDGRIYHSVVLKHEGETVEYVALTVPAGDLRHTPVDGCFHAQPGSRFESPGDWHTRDCPVLEGPCSSHAVKLRDVTHRSREQVREVLKRELIREVDINQEPRGLEQQTRNLNQGLGNKD